MTVGTHNAGRSDASPLAALCGIYPALITPLERDGALDEEACRRIVEHVLSGGVDGVLVLGSSGEGAALGQRTRRRAVEIVAGTLNRRRPFVVGIISASLEDAIEDARHAASAGAIATLAAPPFYGHVDAEMVASFYRRLAAATTVPVVAYNIPAFTRVTIAPTTIEMLAAEGAVSGLKDSSRDFDYFQQVLVRLGGHPTFRVMTGTDSLLLPALVSGAAGGITIGANLVPDLCVALKTAAVQGRWVDAQRLQVRIARIGEAVRRGSFPAGMKTALGLLGLCGPEPAAPARALDEAQRRLLETDLIALGVLRAAEQLVPRP